MAPATVRDEKRERERESGGRSRSEREQETEGVKSAERIGGFHRIRALTKVIRSRQVLLFL